MNSNNRSASGNSVVSVEFWGDYACFSDPACKVERYSFPLPTPTAAAGMMSAIYSKETEFYWNILEVAILNPVRYISLQTNEFKSKFTSKLTPMYRSDTSICTQRTNRILCDVRYRITAEIVPREEFKSDDMKARLYCQAMRRIKSGKCFYQPWLGQREYIAFFEECNPEHTPVDHTEDLGYIVRDLWTHAPGGYVDGSDFARSYFHAKINHGVMVVPPLDSNAVIWEG